MVKILACNHTIHHETCPPIGKNPFEAHHRFATVAVITVSLDVYIPVTMGNKCIHCKLSLRKSRVSSHEEVEWNGKTEIFYKHNNGEYYSISEFSVASLILFGAGAYISLSIDPAMVAAVAHDAAKHHIKTGVPDTCFLKDSHTYICHDCFWRIQQEVHSSKQIDDAEEENTRSEAEDRKALLEEIRKQEHNLKKAELQVEQSLTEVQSKCSPIEHAIRMNHNSEVPYYSQFMGLRRNAKEAQLQTNPSSNVSFSSSDMSGGHAYSPEHEQPLDSDSDEEHSIQLDSDEEHSIQLDSDEEYSIQLMNEPSYYDNIMDHIRDMDILSAKGHSNYRQWLMRVQTYLLLSFTNDTDLDDTEMDILLDALTTIASFLSDRECAKLTMALASVSDGISLISPNLLRVFLGGLVHACHELGFGGACMKQCLLMYLHTCEEGEHYDEEVLRMIAGNVEASLWCIFSAVDNAVTQVDLPALKQQVHLIQTYDIHSSRVSTASLANLQQSKRRYDRGWVSIRKEFHRLNPPSENLLARIDFELLSKEIESQQECDDFLSNGRS